MSQVHSLTSRQSRQLSATTHLRSTNVAADKVKKTARERLATWWARPDVKHRVGTAALIAGPILLLLAGGALAAHIKGLEILGFKMDLEKVAMLLSGAAILTLKGLQYRDEAKELRKREELQKNPTPEIAVRSYDDLARVFDKDLERIRRIQEMPALAETKSQKATKVAALIAGLLLLGLFAYQVKGIVTGSSKLESESVSLISAAAMLGTSATLISQYVLREKKEIGAELPGEVTLDIGANISGLLGGDASAVANVNIPEPAPQEKLKNALLRRLPKGLGLGATIVGGSILALAIVGLGLHYGAGINNLNILGSNSPLTGSMIGNIATVGAGTVFAGVMQMVFARSKEELQEEDAEKAELEKQIDKLKDKLVNLPQVRIPLPQRGAPQSLRAKLTEVRDELNALDTTRRLEATAHKTRHSVQRALGFLAIAGAITLVAVQVASLATTGLGIGRNVVTMVTMAGAAAELAFVAGELLNDSANNKHHEEQEHLRAEKRELELRLKMAVIKRILPEE